LGAYEQAGGLMNLYTDTKTDRMLLGFEISNVPKFKCWIYYTFATVVVGINRKLKVKKLLLF
jgi:POT family proton-dependent oligopeptide transporter